MYGQSDTTTPKALLEQILLSMKQNIHSRKKIRNHDHNTVELYNKFD